MRNRQIRKKAVHRLTVMLAWGMLLCFLCACGGVDSGSADNTATVDLGSTDLTYTDDHVSGTLCEGVEVDADIPDLSNVTSYDIVRVRMQLPDDDVIESMKDYLFDGCSESEITKEQPDEYNYVSYSVAGDISGFGWARIMTISYDVGYNSVTLYNYEAYPFNRVGYSYTIPESDQTRLNYLIGKNETDLSFMKQEEAVNVVQEQLSDWKIDIIGEPMVFNLNGEAMYSLVLSDNESDSAIYYDLDEIESAEELDCYYMVFQVGYNGIPYTPFEFDSSKPDTFTNGAQLHVWFTEEGIIGLEYSYANYEIEETIESHDSVITLDQAMSQVKGQFEEIVQMSEIHISKIYFQYVPTEPDNEIGEYTLVPAWIVQPGTYTTAGGEEVETYLDDVIIVNAFTGEIMT